LGPGGDLTIALVRASARAKRPPVADPGPHPRKTSEE
jgi:hypothetical protein